MTHSDSWELKGTKVLRGKELILFKNMSKRHIGIELSLFNAFNTHRQLLFNVVTT